MANYKKADLGLSYMEAAHGVQTAVAWHQQKYPGFATPKHMRVGIYTLKAEQCGLAELLIEKGVFTQDEYLEAIRVAMNSELAWREEEAREVLGRDITFR